MRSTLLLLLAVTAIWAACPLCGHWCNRALCSSATDGCTSCRPDCGPYGCGAWSCRPPATLSQMMEDCMQSCLGETKLSREHCRPICKQVLITEFLPSNATRNEGDNLASLTGECNVCNLDCDGPNDPWCSQMSSGTYICGTCVFVSDYGGSGYLCQHT